MTRSRRLFAFRFCFHTTPSPSPSPCRFPFSHSPHPSPDRRPLAARAPPAAGPSHVHGHPRPINPACTLARVLSPFLCPITFPPFLFFSLPRLGGTGAVRAACVCACVRLLAGFVALLARCSRCAALPINPGLSFSILSLFLTPYSPVEMAPVKKATFTTWSSSGLRRNYSLLSRLYVFYAILLDWCVYYVDLAPVGCQWGTVCAENTGVPYSG